MRSEERAQMARPVLENDSMQLEPQRRRGQFLITQGNHMSLIAHANSHNFLYKIGDGENVVTCSSLADACAHGDVGCARKFAESGSILSHHRLV